MEKEAEPAAVPAAPGAPEVDEGAPFEEDERTIFIDYMMNIFRKDRRVRKLLLLSCDSDEIYRVLSDGVILWYVGGLSFLLCSLFTLPLFLTVNL